MRDIYAKGRSYSAQAWLCDDYSVIVKKGSTISPASSKSLSGKISKIRNDKDVVDSSHKVLADVCFHSASTAACFVTGTMSNGFKVWKYQGGKKYISRNMQGD